MGGTSLNWSKSAARRVYLFPVQIWVYLPYSRGGAQKADEHTLLLQMGGFVVLTPRTGRCDYQPVSESLVNTELVTALQEEF